MNVTAYREAPVQTFIVAEKDGTVTTITNAEFWGIRDGRIVFTSSLNTPDESGNNTLTYVGLTDDVQSVTVKDSEGMDTDDVLFMAGANV